MFAFVTSAILLALAFAMALQTSQNLDLMRLYRFTVQRSQLVMLAENLEMYYIERGAYPASLTALSQTSGYEHVKSMLNNWQGYAVSDVLTDSTWQYRRMVVFSRDPTKGDTVASYLASNGCGTGDFGAADTWCGTRKTIWYRKETRVGMNEAVSNQRVQLDRTLQKFADFYSANGIFPGKDNTDLALTVGTTYALAALAGYNGTGSACTGIYTWRGLPIGCEDMFDAWGGKVGFVYTSDKAISLISETPLVNAAGVPLMVASGYTM
jgi:hypothetical protein